LGRTDKKITIITIGWATIGDWPDAPPECQPILDMSRYKGKPTPEQVMWRCQAAGRAVDAVFPTLDFRLARVVGRVVQVKLARGAGSQIAIATSHFVFSCRSAIVILLKLLASLHFCNQRFWCIASGCS